MQVEASQGNTFLTKRSLKLLIYILFRYKTSDFWGGGELSLCRVKRA